MGLSRRELLAAGAAAVASRPSLAAMLAERKIPVKIGATDWNLRQEVKLEALALARKIGFEGVEVSLGSPPVPGPGGERLPLADPELQAKYRDEARKQGVAIAGTCLNILHRNYLKNDPLGKRWVADAIPITKALGGRVILLPFFGKGQLETRAEMDYVADFLREIGPEAKKAGIMLGLENTNSAVDNLYMIERAACPAVRCFYDIGNSAYYGRDVVSEIRLLGRENICEMHLKDNPHYLGEGKINLPAVIDAIDEIRFDGWAHLETDSPSKDVEADMGRNLRFVRALMAKRDARDASVKGLPGWHVQEGKPEVWEGEGGLIRCKGGGGGFLTMDQEYGDFDLSLEYKIEPGGNSGIGVHYPPGGHPSQLGMEIQILDDDAPKHKGLLASQYNGSIYKLVPPKRRAAKAPGEWNKIEVSCHGPMIRVVLNGVEIQNVKRDDFKTAEHDEIPLAKRPRHGCIGLQSHDGVVEFRGLRIRS